MSDEIMCHWKHPMNNCNNTATKFCDHQGMLYAECDACAKGSFVSTQTPITREEYITRKTMEALDVE